MAETQNSSGLTGWTFISLIKNRSWGWRVLLHRVTGGPHVRGTADSALCPHFYQDWRAGRRMTFHSMGQICQWHTALPSCPTGEKSVTRPCGCCSERQRVSCVQLKSLLRKKGWWGDRSQSPITSATCPLTPLILTSSTPLQPQSFLCLCRKTF